MRIARKTGMKLAVGEVAIGMCATGRSACEPALMLDQRTAPFAERKATLRIVGEHLLVPDKRTAPFAERKATLRIVGAHLLMPDKRTRSDRFPWRKKSRGHKLTLRPSTRKRRVEREISENRLAGRVIPGRRTRLRGLSCPRPRAGVSGSVPLISVPANLRVRRNGYLTLYTRSDWPDLGRPGTLANAADATPSAGRFPVIRLARWGDQFRRLKGRWHRAPSLVQAPEQFKTAISRPKKRLESGGMIRHKFRGSRRLCFDDLGAAHTPRNSCFGSIPNMQKWHKRPQKAATLCHFLSFFWAPFKDRHTHRAFARKVACSLANTETSLPRSCGTRCRRQVDYQAGAKQLRSEARGGSIGKAGGP